MESQIKLNVSSVSNMGKVNSTNQDNFYMNGRYRYDYEMENIQVSSQVEGKDCIFAVSDGLDRAATEKRPSISMVRELKKFQDQLNMKNGDFVSRIGLLKDRLEETNNIIYSMSLHDESEEQEVAGRETSFSSVFISEGKMVALNMGRGRSYLFRDGILKALSGDMKKTEKLLKMGIITNEQASLLAGKFGIPTEDSKTTIQKSEIIEIKPGDLFVICSDGITSVLDEEKVNEILSIDDKETGLISNILVREALKSGSKDNLTALVVKVEQCKTMEEVKPVRTESQTKRIPRPVHTKKRKGLPTLVASLAVILIAVSILIVASLKLCLFSGGDIGLQEVSTDKIMTVSENAEETMGEDRLDGETPTPEQEPSANDLDTYQGLTINEEGKKEYKVKPGDSLQKISKRFYQDTLRYTDIMEANNISDPNNIKIGQILIIP